MSFSDSNFSFCENSWKNLLDMGFIFVKRDIYIYIWFICVTVMYCGGSSKLVEPSTTSLLKLLVNLWQTRSCQKVMLTFFLSNVDTIFDKET